MFCALCGVCFVFHYVVSCVLRVVLLHFSDSISEPVPTSINRMTTCRQKQTDEFFGVAGVLCVLCVMCVVVCCVACSVFCGLMCGVVCDVF